MTTIKRRLHITNVLVLVIPFLVALLTNIIVILVVVYGLRITDFASLDPHAIWLGTISPLVVAITLPLTNMLLTRLVIKKITDPIDLLSYGVHQIRDGNLSYRIEYAGNDEFASICADFNEMAWHLNELVCERQKNEDERKELIAGISHDLRTPLTSIKAYVEGLEKGVAATPQAQKKYLDTIRIKTAELEQIINQLFLFSKVDLDDYPLTFEKTDIVLTLENLVCEIAEEYRDKGLNITLQTPMAALRVNADQQQLRNILMNVIENSLKYKTKVTGELKIACNAASGEAEITLTDNGDGVPGDALDKLFTVFYRVDASRGAKEGSGLGLAIAAKTCQRMGGRIRAANVAGGGLSVIINLPLLEGTAEGAAL